MAEEFKPTHILSAGWGELIEVCLVDGQAFQRKEWDAGADQTEYERHEEGQWTYRGQPFKGGVKHVEPRG